MSTIQVRIKIAKEETKKGTMVNRVKSIRLASENITYIFPPELQYQKLHNNLFNLNTIKNACKSMSKRGQFRNISVTLPEEIIPLYFDDEKNTVFNEVYLGRKIRL